MICQLPSCNLFTQHVCFLWRDTTSEPMAPGPIFLIDTTSFKHFHHCFFVVPFLLLLLPNTRYILYSSFHQDWKIENLSEIWGQQKIVCCVQVPRLLTCQTASNLLQVFEVLLVDKPWFHNWGKSPLDYIIPSSWGNPTRM